MMGAAGTVRMCRSRAMEAALITARRRRCRTVELRKTASWRRWPSSRKPVNSPNLGPDGAAVVPAGKGCSMPACPNCFLRSATSGPTRLIGGLFST